ncbi:hypothetical protein BD310DRAFT_495884 [Dichomitus squalens]|uniref:Uncharacterized protein n=1 Tax=Dichomitus squalens TaxID=114155 RepID=A0A4V2K652_9APHY|nr:hypothetical protein BD310DRAFT_495884 [Dichomitus squalens]
MKKLAARDFEQILQCAMPVFEGLLPEPYNSLILDLIFELSMWHAFAKLSLHTDTTLSKFQAVTVSLGKAMRAFVSRVCPFFDTKELPRETQSRQRRKAASAQNVPGGRAAPSEDDSSPKIKSFNVNTIKYHRLGDYVRMVRQTGTSDNSNTQTVAAEVRRQAVLDRIHRGIPVSSTRRRTRATPTTKTRRRHDIRVQFEEDQPLSATVFTDHHHMSIEQRYPQDIGEFLHANAGDPACKVCTCWSHRAAI